MSGVGVGEAEHLEKNTDLVKLANSPMVELRLTSC